MRRDKPALQWILIALVVVGLVVDAVVHYDLASAFKHNKTSLLSEPEIFRIQATVSLLAALAVSVRPRRYTAAFAFLVGASVFAAVVVYRYVDVGKIGPIPNMYDPYWAPAGKVLSAVGEAVAALAAGTLFWMLSTATPRLRSSRGAGRADAGRSRQQGLTT